MTDLAIYWLGVRAGYLVVPVRLRAVPEQETPVGLLRMPSAAVPHGFLPHALGGLWQKENQKFESQKTTKYMN